MSDSTYHHGDLKAALVAAAREQIATEGASSLNLRALARSLGVTHPAVYRHFADKGALLAAVAEVGFMELTAMLTTAVQEGDELNARLYSLATAYVDLAIEQPELTRLMFGLISAEDRAQNPGLYAASKRSLELLIRTVSGHDSDDKTDAVIMWAMMHGLAQLTIEEQIPVLNDQNQRATIIARAVDALSKGFLS